jgi:hypothetical protein
MGTSSRATAIPSRVGIPLATIILSALGVFFVASGQYGGSSWQWNGFSHNHPSYFLAKMAYFEATLGYLLLVIGWGIAVKQLVARIGVAAYVIGMLGLIAPITVEFLSAIQCSWDSSGFYAGSVWYKNWSTIILMLSYELLAVALLVGGLVARSRSRR